MENHFGKIDKTWENTTKSKKKYHVLEIGHEKYSVWDEKLMEGLNEGCSVDYDWKASGNFKKIVELRKIDPEPFSEHQYKNRKSMEIIRMSCLRSATEILNGVLFDLDQKTGMALDIAKEFEKYVLSEIYA